MKMEQSDLEPHGLGTPRSPTSMVLIFTVVLRLDSGMLHRTAVLRSVKLPTEPESIRAARTIGCSEQLICTFIIMRGTRISGMGFTTGVFSSDDLLQWLSCSCLGFHSGH